MAAKIRIGDEVIVIAGKDKSKSGKVKKLVKRSKPFGADLWVLVEGVNVCKKHIKADPQKGQEGGIVAREAAIHSSNILLKNPATNKPDRVGFKTLEDGRKVRFYKSTGEVVVDVRS
jgi:large subunit ribosomal protein L24